VTAPPLFIVGATCTGKTTLAIDLARRLRGAELLNADSRQLRRGLRVGTCAPSPADLHGVAIHLMDLADPGVAFTVADWVAAARRVLDDLARRTVQPVVVGGTGLYVSALVDGLALAGVPGDPSIRERRNQQASSPAGLAELVALLRARDPEGAATTDLRNPRRVIRALEILDGGAGTTLAEARGRSAPLPALLVGLQVAPATHAGWVRDRTTRMFGDGSLAGEVSGALASGVSRAALAVSGIGYTEMLAVLDGQRTAAEAIETTIARTLRYAKAQRTYFRRDRRIHWLRADQLSGGEQVAAVMRLGVAESEMATAPPR
jgi:tRNA dimethylallyltransferase